MASEDESKAQGEVGEAGGAAESDDLASLADGLPSLRPAAGESAEGSEDDGRLDLARLVGSAASSIEDAAGPQKTGEPAADSTALKNLAAAASSASVMPPAQAKRTWLVPMLVGLGLGVGLAGVGFGLSANRAPAPPAASPASEPASAAPVPPAQPPVAAAPVQEDPAPTLAAAANPGAPPSIDAVPEKPQAPDHRATTAARTPPRSSAASAGAPAAPAEPANPPSAPDEPLLKVKPAAEAAPPAADDPLAEPAADNTKQARSMDALLDEALAPAAQRQELAHQRELAMHGDELPLTPTRDDVTKAMTVLLPAIRGCAMGQSGLATAGIVVRNDGRVASVEIAGAPFANTASGRCMEGVMRRAQFPRFKQSIFRIKFPFAIQ